MAIGKASDFTMYHDQFHAGYTETVAQAAEQITNLTRGAIKIIPRAHIGDYAKETFYKSVSSLVSRRDTTTVSAATDLALTQGELVGPKCARLIGPATNTLDSLNKVGATMDEFAAALGEQAGKAALVSMLNTGLYALVGCAKDQTALTNDLYNVIGHTVNATHSTTTANLNKTLGKFGDRAGSIAAWAMHSTPWFDLAGANISGGLTNVADSYINNGINASINRPVFQTDSSALTQLSVGSSQAGYVGYHILGLVENALVLEESEARHFAIQEVTGLHNLVIRYQGEFAFTVKVKGMAYATGSGINPTDATIATAAAWAQVATSDKDLSGVRLFARAAV